MAGKDKMDGLTAVIILSVTGLLVLLLNIFCITVIGRNKKLREKPSSMLTINLLAMHILQAVLVMPFYAAKRYLEEKNPREPTSVCDGFRYFYMITFYIACFNVLLISLDRLLAIELKTKYKTTVTCGRVFKALAIVWVYVVAMCSIPFAYPKPNKCNYNPQPAWVLFMLIGNCFIPCVAIVIIYCYIIYSLSRFNAKMHSSTEDNIKVAPISKSNKRITRNTLILVISYGVAWMPSIIYFTIQTIFPSTFSESYKDSSFEQYVSFFLKYVKFVEGIASPVLYCYLNSYFKSTLNLNCCGDGSSVDVRQRCSSTGMSKVIMVEPCRGGKQSASNNTT